MLRWMSDIMRRTRKSIYRSEKKKRTLKILGFSARIFISVIFIMFLATSVTAETFAKYIVWDKIKPASSGINGTLLADASGASSSTSEESSSDPAASTEPAAAGTGETGTTSNISITSASGSATVKTNTLTASAKISLSVEDADIRDVLSAIALSTNTNIIFTEQPVRVTFKMNNVTYLTALEYLLKSYGLNYIISDNVIIVGKNETLEQNFHSRELFARFDLKYITAGQLKEQVDQLSLPVRQIIFDDKSKTMWAQGTSQYLSKMRELISMIDIPENAVKADAEDETEEQEPVVKLIPFELQFIDANTCDSFIQQLGMDIKTIVIDNNPKTIWITAKESEVAQLEEIIKLIDAEENSAPEEQRAPLDLIPYELEFVSSDNISSIASQMGLNVKLFYLSSNPYKIWLDARSKDIKDFEELIKEIDIMENGKWFLEVTTLKLKYLTADKFKNIVAQLDIPVQIITLDSNAYTVWVSGTARDIVDVKLLLSDIDIDKVREDSAFFIYKLWNISPEEAVTRFKYLQITDADLFTLKFPLFSKEILVVCKPDRMAQIELALEGIDVSGEKIRIPVDSSAYPSQLTARRDLLVSLTGVPTASFFISNNVSRVLNPPQYIMWVEETPENIQKILDMINSIDSLTGGGTAAAE